VAVVPLLLSFACIAAAVLYADSAPQQAVWVGLACYFGIMSRLAQAYAQHADHMEGLKRLVKLVRDQGPRQAPVEPLQPTGER
jgi:hypothetical protein